MTMRPKMVKLMRLHGDSYSSGAAYPPDPPAEQARRRLAESMRLKSAAKTAPRPPRRAR